MTDLYRDPITGDIALTGTNQVRLTESDEEETMQRVKSRLQRWAGEWFANRNLGVPYRRDILIKNPDLQVVRGVLRAEVEADPGIEVVRTIELEVDPVTRHMTARFEAQMSDGEVVEFDIPIAPVVSDTDFILELEDGETVV